MPPMTAHKAVAAAIAGVAVPVLTWLSAWLMSSDPWSWRSFAAAVVGSALTGLGAGGLTWAVPNTPKTLHQHEAAAVAAENVHSPSMGPDAP